METRKKNSEYAMWLDMANNNDIPLWFTEPVRSATMNPQIITYIDLSWRGTEMALTPLVDTTHDDKTKRPKDANILRGNPPARRAQIQHSQR